MKIPEHRQLRAFLAAVAPLGLLLTGCSSVVGDFDGEVCLFQPGALSDLTPVAGTDLVRMRRAWDNFDEMVPVPETVAQWGTACATASDGAACQAALGKLAIADGALRTDTGQITAFYDVIFSRADETGRVSDAAALVALLGTIDTPSEAALVAFAEGHDLPCDEKNWRKQGDSFVLLGTRGSGCGDGEDISQYEITVNPAGTVTEGESEVVESGDPNCAIGRRPDGLCSRTRKAHSVGSFFANAAHLEAASVHAFAHLAGELAAHGAPRKLIDAAWRARADEMRHAHSTARLARRYGGVPVRPVVGQRQVRTLFDVARDNGVEGCVRETFGAVVATAQSRRALSRHVRAAMSPIAEDETRHAVLSWAIDEWIQSKITPRQRRKIDEGRAEALALLRRETTRGHSDSITAVTGMPSPDAGMRMLEPMAATLWQVA